MHRGFYAVLSFGCCAVLLTGCGGAGISPKAPAIERQKLDGVLITTLAGVPGWTIAETKGVQCAGVGFDGNGKYWPGVDQAMESMRTDATKTGANAVVNFRLSSASFEVQGSKWHASITHLCGDSVVLR